MDFIPRGSRPRARIEKVSSQDYHKVTPGRPPPATTMRTPFLQLLSHATSLLTLGHPPGYPQGYIISDTNIWLLFLQINLLIYFNLRSRLFICWCEAIPALDWNKQTNKSANTTTTKGGLCWSSSNLGRLDFDIIRNKRWLLSNSWYTSFRYMCQPPKP